ncbi:MAG: hypothetical protein A3C90_00480 [Candidatus Magasanikbacteria bacterium RIFCSPHIGHO2_02_FULL_51_14]|uniref:Ribbon-helix-helix protein CopG domain-containing protein n=1 Tax=Candidatus Magasanikbacteria bacterium RIFCSPHIGHO2_02_FULL_51_14 TaxID=1798683 RepID=A0A1F6MHF5_9BACT|nr:MAG: hypothetical protein A3C90_00480 [Candidatus Magasanikbacteria bacterium RIFCSPHIGHO2_02_FULL_51_14]
MRQSSVVTISLPPTLVKEVERVAKKNRMTRSELLRAALRTYFEWRDTEEAIKAFEKEKREGTLKELEGSLVDLM